MKLNASVRNGELVALVSLDIYHYATTTIAGYAIQYVLVSSPASSTNGRSRRWGMIFPSRYQRSYISRLLVRASDLVMASTQPLLHLSGSNLSPFDGRAFTPRICSRAFEYAINIHNQSRVKTVIYSRVVLGRSFLMANEMPSLWNAPLGFDSVSLFFTLLNDRRINV
jgi:hypothetical protein